MSKKEFKIGEIFQLGKVSLRVEKSVGSHACSGCFFNVSVPCDYSDILVGSCIARDREDNQSVVFVEVKE